ncbi:hypothetical protein BLA29_005168 [Euroglyphus maynei]|uniref:Uncharacterized protein n=1 Tax=Euroglyphus maynei TaxID=6958 RepID=A0A1Y3B436_EURMA|nr:hypothetical protein BLA29_005168 [Euroglyphus maynei]
MAANNNVHHRGGSPLANYAQQSAATVQHQRSKSVGVSSRFSLNHNHNNEPTKLLMPPPILPESNNVNVQNHQLSSPMNSNRSKQQQKSLLFSSPYVNKYDTSVQSLLKSNERSNLYSVPNRRTSVALNSLDDTVIGNQPNISDRYTIIYLHYNK